MTSTAAIIFWRPVGCFGSMFNRFVSKLSIPSTNDRFCHAEVQFTLKKHEWFKSLAKFEASSIVGQRAKNLSIKLKTVLKDIPDHTKIPLVFYILWGEQVTVRMLTLTNVYEFNRTPNHTSAAIVPLQLDDNQRHCCLAFCISQLGKSYNRIGAMFYWCPRPYYSTHLPSQFFCSELLVIMLQTAGMLQGQHAERICPNRLFELLN